MSMWTGRVWLVQYLSFTNKVILLMSLCIHFILIQHHMYTEAQKFSFNKSACYLNFNLSRYSQELLYCTCPFASVTIILLACVGWYCNSCWSPQILDSVNTDWLTSQTNVYVTGLIARAKKLCISTDTFVTGSANRGLIAFPIVCIWLSIVQHMSMVPTWNLITLHS